MGVLQDATKHNGQQLTNDATKGTERQNQTKYVLLVKFMKDEMTV